MTAQLIAADPAATGTAVRSRPPGREPFLDALRGIALVRVVVWHTFASAVISWCVAAMPAMFFVAGSLLASALDRGDLRRLLLARIRRLMLPFWWFASVILLVLAVYHQTHRSTASALPLWSLATWVIPLLDPKAPNWTGGWVSEPLWYIRCYLWLLLLAPLLRAAHRRWGLWVAIVPAVGVFLVDQLVRSAATPQWVHSAQWYLGDLTTYSVFLLLGFSHRDGAFRSIDAAARWEWAAAGGAAALLWWRMVPVPGNVVNNSYPLLLFVGVAWLGVFLALEGRIVSIATTQFGAAILRWLNRRAVTIYLWHSPAIVAAYWIRSTFAPDLPVLSVILFVVPCTLALVVLMGRVEDRAARRPAQWWPGRRDPEAGHVGRWGRRLFASLDRCRPTHALVAGLAVSAVLIAFAAPTPNGTTRTAAPATPGGVKLPPAPSGKPEVAEFTTGGAPAGATPSSPPAAEPGGVPGGTPGDDAAGTSTAPGTSPSTPSGMGAVRPGEPTAKGPREGEPADEKVVTRISVAVSGWQEDKKVDGVVLAAILPDGSVAQVANGTGVTGGDAAVTDRVPITSVTKSMTSAVILNLVAQGKLALDDPLPDLKRRPGLPWVGKVTVRQLLNHTAGVRPYDKTAGYEAVRANPLTPEQALDLVAADPAPLEWTPGSQAGYSNSGYLTLGLLAEQAAGVPYADLLKTYVFGPAAMTASTLDETPSAGWSGYSAGGVLATVPDILAWGDALFRTQKAVPKEQLAEMVDVTNPYSAGLGAFPICPCAEAGDGSRVYTSIGHSGGQTMLQFSPGDSMVIAVWLSESMWVATPSQDDVFALLAAVRSAATSA